MKCMTEIVSLNAVEIVYITFLAIQPIDTVIVDVPPDISMFFVTKVGISANYKKLRIIHTLGIPLSN